MLSICPNNQIMVVNDNANNLLFFEIKTNTEIRLLKTEKADMKIGAHCFNYTGKYLLIT
jgi:hypothetical protein